MVEFPNLWGLKFELNPEAFSVFGVPVFWYGIIIAAGFLLAVVLALKNSKRFGIDQDHLIDVVLFATPVAIIFARLYYVAFRPDLFKSFTDVINIRNGGLAIYGGILGALLVAMIYSRKKKMSALNLLDFAVPYIVLAQSVGRWGNFVNMEAFGGPTGLPWGMTIAGKTAGPVHPTFLYESLWDFGIFLLLIWFRKRKKLNGEVLCLYMAGYGLGRAWIEGLRTDSLMVGTLRVSQLLAIVFVIVFMGVFIWRRTRLSRKEELEAVEVGQSQYGTVLQKLKDEEASAQPAEEPKPDMQAEEETDSVEEGTDVRQNDEEGPRE